MREDADHGVRVRWRDMMRDEDEVDRLMICCEDCDWGLSSNPLLWGILQGIFAAIVADREGKSDVLSWVDTVHIGTYIDFVAVAAAAVAYFVTSVASLCPSVLLASVARLPQPSSAADREGLHAGHPSESSSRISRRRCHVPASRQP